MPAQQKTLAEVAGNSKVYWGQEPVQNLSSKRSQIVLNGPWQFMPARGTVDAASPAEWGLIWVPGAWKGPTRLPGIIERGQGAAWEYYDGNTLGRAWYSRSLQVPSAWQGRAVLLDFERVSTDAVVYVNGQNCGHVRWPEGTVDITKAVTPGRDAKLVVDVAATGDEKTAADLLASTNNKVVIQPDEQGKELASRGITGDVILLSRPLGVHVSDVFVQPSVRKWQLGLQVELSGVAQSGPIQLRAKLLNEQGREEKRFEQQIQVSTAQSQTVHVVWPWKNPRLWDERNPNLYTLQLEVRGAGLEDEYAQPFGFRELWIQGRRILLNGTDFRMRPMNQLSADDWSEIGGNRLAIANHIDASIKNGFNIQEIWPSPQPRGTHRAWSAWYEVADAKGWPMIGAALPAVPYSQTNAAEWAKNKDAYRRDAERYLRRIRNHPSVLVWGLDGNKYSHSSDQNPTYIGRTGYQDREPWYKDSIVTGMESVAVTKSLDPTRPVIAHHGTYVGDMQTTNNYLCLTPLQEREEWLSAWAKNGEMPYMAIEFGLPLFNTFLRGRDEFHHSIFTEPWVTEFQTIYLGDRAYKLETDAYKKQIRQRYDSTHQRGDQHYHNNWFDSFEAIHNAGLEEIYSLFITNTWRSWRTWGLTGGMVPWDLANVWRVESRPDVKLPAFKPGTRGTYKATMKAAEFYGLGDERGGYKRLPAAEALIHNNSATLAWISGPAAAFTAKDHHYISGQRIHKQVVLINDSRRTQPFSFEWKFIVGAKTVASGRKSGRIETGKNLFFPISPVAPIMPAEAKVKGVLNLRARIGDASHTDAFAVQLFGPHRTASVVRQAVHVYDPVGKTTKMLKTLGIATVAWTGQASAKVVIVGREALSSAKHPGTALPGNLEALVRQGGRVLLLEQEPEWVRKQLGLRVAHHVSRRMYAVASHPALKGWDREELRDWNGSSTMLPAQFETGKASVDGHPLYPRWGWHWGNRHGVSSGAVEKPHFGAWRPLLEGEFDLAYSPLMELDYGQGRLLLCTLDLEDHVAVDPAAARLARRILQYAAEAPLRPRARQVVFLGQNTSLLDALGIHFRKSDQLDPKADLVIVSSDAKVPDGVLTAYLMQGGKVFLLPRTEENAVLGVATKATKEFGGSTNVPSWPEASGLSPADLRWRSFGDVCLIQSGAEIGADGLLARKTVGQGVAIFSQMNPAALQADKFTYMRFTRWRQTRAISQLLANLGASFRTDKAIFQWASPKWITLTGSWRAKITQKLDGNSPGEDKGLSQVAGGLVGAEVDDASWQEVQVPADWSQYGEEWANMNGEAVFRRVLTVPADWAGKDIHLDLGSVDNFDNTYFNGVEVGASGPNINIWSAPKRFYTIPGQLVKAGKNVLVVRVFDVQHGGGLKGGEGNGPMKYGPDQMKVTINELYHSDYRRDYALGDDPYRYFRW